MVEMMFEHFQVQNVYVALDSVMFLYGSGRRTGLVCDIGEDFTRSVPVIEGFSVPHAVEKS
jgi:actin